MKKFLTILILLSAYISQVYAIDAGTDMTSYIKNAGFESTNYTLISGGKTQIPENWMYNYNLSGWIDIWSGENTGKVPEGKQYLNVWAGSVTYLEFYQGMTLPAGVYTLTAQVYTTQPTNQPTHFCESWKYYL